MIEPKLRKAIRDAWEDPSKEDAILDLLEEVSPGVFKCQFLDPDRIKVLRDYFDQAAESGIPVRPPYGITLNRKGFMLDERSEGYLATKEFQQFYKMLSDDYLRPLGRLCYPHYIQNDDDCETFGFSIKYKPDTETSIRQHSDSSSLTFNFNFNVPSDGKDTWQDPRCISSIQKLTRKIMSVLNLELQSFTLAQFNMPHCRLKRASAPIS